ncbi:arginyltransferase [Ferrimonas balearica]|uniref:arginyltransferase n=1 Tax=Ferrimonas balearica TaxID=44012 RepID=UPI001C98FF3A|nr:arginyltransferase [Ferrimonas balearica]MBY5920327.1 arginyltransferase [Ferrimonas balearica]MBY5996988.1 arginyltransferase [Ferrimonas balearica]
MSDIRHLSLGLSQSFPCSYLPDQFEQLLVNREPVDGGQFEQLLALGFRRSGGQIYRPHCQACQACVPVRLPVQRFQPSRSQKRVISKNRDLVWRVTTRPTPEQQALYLEYICQRHNDGPMYPPSLDQFDRFLVCDWLEQLYLEAWLDDDLALVAVTDLLPNSLSATYTFFQPALADRSLGTRAILAQIGLAQQLGRDYLYLGYQIDDCQKMAYKTHFQPLQRLEGQQWLDWRG